MLLLEAFLLGFFVKVITGIDDMLTRVPVLTSLARTRRGKVAFSLGAVTAVCVATLVAYAFSEILHTFQYFHTIVAVLIFALALAIYFDVFVRTPQKRVEKTIQKKIPRASFEKLSQLFGIGFIASLTTVLDDTIAYMPVFFGTGMQVVFGIAGILVATLLQALVVIFFSEYLERIPHKKEISVVGLLLLAIAIFTGIL